MTRTTPLKIGKVIECRLGSGKLMVVHNLRHRATYPSFICSCGLDEDSLGILTNAPPHKGRQLGQYLLERYALEDSLVVALIVLLLHIKEERGVDVSAGDGFALLTDIDAVEDMPELHMAFHLVEAIADELEHRYHTLQAGWVTLHTTHCLKHGDEREGEFLRYTYIVLAIRLTR